MNYLDYPYYIITGSIEHSNIDLKFQEEKDAIGKWTELIAKEAKYPSGWRVELLLGKVKKSDENPIDWLAKYGESWSEYWERREREKKEHEGHV